MRNKVPPEWIAALPVEPVKVPTNVPVVPTSPSSAEAKVEPSLTPSEAPPAGGAPQVEAEVPTNVAVLQYVQPLIAKGLTMVELRRKLGHEKGKQWTAMLNELVDTIVGLCNQHLAPPAIYATLRQQYGTSMGSLVAAIRKLPRTSDGTIIGTFENEILCSNPRGASMTGTGGGAKEGRNEVEHSKAEGAPSGAAVVPGDNFDVDEALKHI